MIMCQEPARKFPPMTKVMRRGLICKGKSGLEGPPRICLSIYPKAIPDHLSLKEINLEL